MPLILEPTHLIVFCCMGLFTAVPLWLIAEKAGVSRWPALFAVFPPFFVFVAFYVALARWHPRAA